MKMEDYKPGDTIYILLGKIHAGSVMTEWLEGRWQCDLTMHRSAKTKGCVVLETKSLMFASRVIQWHQWEKVTYKRPKARV